MKTEARGGETECMVSSSRLRDLLLRFSDEFSPDDVEEANGSDSDEIELGLSLGGCFNSASSHKNRILRTSSIPAILPCEVSPLFPLLRTWSLPEEEIQNKTRVVEKRKREVMRTLRRLGERVEVKLEEDPVLKLKRFEVENKGSWIRGSGPAKRLYSPLTSCITGAGLPSTLRNGITPATQGSAVSEGSNSSVVSELESRSGQGFELSGFSHNDHKSPPLSPLSKPINGAAISNGTVSHATHLPRNNNGGRCINGSGEQSKGANKKMPLVSTKGDGPDGVRLNGLLYTYGSGEEVRIVCVCHGKFLTPSEFVKHAGGGDVAHPLRHIVVSPNTAFF